MPYRYWKLTCYMRSHSVTCHPAEVWIPPLPPAEAGTRFSDPGGMQGRVNLRYVKADRPGIEPATCKSQVQRPTAAPPRKTVTQSINHLLIFVRGFVPAVSCPWPFIQWPLSWHLIRHMKRHITRHGAFRHRSSFGFVQVSWKACRV